jgi:hypothetical protein
MTGNKPGSVHMQRALHFLTVIGIFILIACSGSKTDLYKNDPKFRYGWERLTKTFQKHNLTEDSIKINFEIDPDLDHEESYSINVSHQRINISGADAVGLMYGCLELSDRIDRFKNIPADLTISESPQMRWRGVCLLLMKLGTYNYPVTLQDFPFFYDKNLWIAYLDFLAANKFNYIALWNGHPFAYFVRMKKYPEAQAGIPEGLVDRNNEMLHWLVAESGRRNIKLVFEFYNIHTSVYFQKAHNLPDEISEPSPVLEEYTSYCIENFVREFPETGLYITAGEALDRKYAAYWVNTVPGF